MNVLFVCSKNKWRSPTGEAIFRKDPALNVRSAGTSKSAKRVLKAADIHWADLILVMEEKHKSRIRNAYRNDLNGVSVHVLDIPDEYQFMDPELIDLLSAKSEPLIYQE